MDSAIEGALRFFESLLSSEHGWPKRHVRLGGSDLPTVLVWTDASAEEDELEAGRIGYVVYFPESDEWVHGSAPVAQAFLEGFVARKTYIGQYELLAAVCVYLSLGDKLRGRRVIHWVDNQGAVAALTKGYAQQVDSAKIVHAFHAWNSGARTSVWFEYVRSKANIADLPSRNTFELLDEMGSRAVEPVRMPGVDDWAREAEWWQSGARGEPTRRAERGGRRKRKRPSSVRPDV
jgi:hypothetical protein